MSSAPGGPADDGGPLTATVPADPAQLSALRARLAAWLARTEMSEDDIETVVLAAYEALANAVEHAYPDGDGPVGLHARHTDGCTVITVTDNGQWQPPPTDPGNRCRGLPLMRWSADDVQLRRTQHGTTIELRWTHR